MKYRKKWFFEEDDGGGGGGGEPSGSEAPPGQVGAPNQDGGGGAPPAAAPSAFDPKTLSSAFAGALKEAGFSPSAPADKPLSPEEAKKLLNFFDIDDKFVEEWGNVDTKKARMEALRDGIVRHTDTITQMRLRDMQKALRDEFGPVMKLVQENSQRDQQQRFSTAFPQLGSAKLQPLMHAVVQQQIASGKQYSDEGEMFKSIAEDMAAVIREHKPDFTIGTSVPKAASKLPVTSPGGGGGGGGNGGGGASAGVPRAVSLLPKIRG